MNAIGKDKVFKEVYEYGEKCAAKSMDYSIRYCELAALCDKFENRLNKKCLVFHLCSNTMGAFAGYVALMNSQQVPLMLDGDIEKEVFVELLKQYRPQYIFLPKKRYVEYSEYKVCMEVFDYILVSTEYEIDYCIDKELGLLLPTSGSTGSPKFVRQSYNNIRSNAESIIEYLELSESEKPITTLPMNYTYGLSIIHSHLLVGATLLITDKGILQKEFWEFFTREGATSIAGVPYHYQMLKRIGFIRKKYPSLRTMTQAGGRLSENLQLEFGEYAEQQEIKFFVMYGQTEATARMTYLPCNKVREKCGSIGIPIPGGNIELVDDSGSLIKESGMAGELVYQGPNVTMGYAEHYLDLSRGDERSGKLFTGDVAKRDEDGFYYIVGRKKRMIKVFGNRINLDDIDRIVKDKFKEIDCCSWGREDELFIFLNSEDAWIQREIKEYISNKIKINSIAITMKYMNDIPRNDSGKIIYSSLESLV